MRPSIAAMADTFDPLALADLAAGQWGMLTTAQARHVGATPQQVADLATAGYLERLRHGVYRIAGTPTQLADDLRASWLATDPARTATARLADPQQTAVASYKSAARLHEIGDLDADPMEFTVPRRKQSRRRDIRYHVAPTPVDGWTLIEGLPTTTVTVTITDLAAARIDGGHLATIVRDAISTGQAAVDDIANALRPFAHRYGAPIGDGAGLVSRLLDEAGAPPPPPTTAAVLESMAGLLRKNPSLDPQISPTQRMLASLGQSVNAAGWTSPLTEIAARNPPLGRSLRRQRPSASRVCARTSQPQLGSS